MVMDKQKYMDAFHLASSFASSDARIRESPNITKDRFGSWSEAFLYAFTIVGLELKSKYWVDPAGLDRDMTMPHPPDGEIFLWDVDARCGPINIEKCNYADKYKAIRMPTCGCNFCADMWAKAVEAKGGS
jgi:hypothetical protein